MVRAIDIYRAPNGIWRIVIERDGVRRWASLHTRDYAKAKASFERLKAACVTANELFGPKNSNVPTARS